MKKIISICMVLGLALVTSVSSLNASEFTISNDAGKEFTSGELVCANRSYYINTESNLSEVVIVDGTTHMVLKVLSANSQEIEIMFPENATNLIVYVTPYTNQKVLDNTKEKSISIKSEPCDYDVVEPDYTTVAPLAGVTFNGTNINITKPVDANDYEFEYQFLGEKAQKAKSSDSIVVGENNIFQFKESYTKDDVRVEKYYELEINPTTKSYFIREVDSFEIKTINPFTVLNKKLLVVLMLLFIILIGIRFKIKKEKKVYRDAKIQEKLEGRKR